MACRSSKTNATLIWSGKGSGRRPSGPWIRRTTCSTSGPSRNLYRPQCVLAPWEVLSRMLACKTDSGTGALGELIVADFFQNHYEEHMQRLRASLRRKLEAMTVA